MVVLLMMVGCLQDETVICPSARVCPPGTVCTATGCADRSQLDACVSKPDGDRCDYGPNGVCTDGVCEQEQP
jgi:hypothetical protein